MTPGFSRRFLLAMPLIGLAACSGALGNYAYEDAVRRLLRISSERAFARLVGENGFAGVELAPEGLPDRLGPQLIYAAETAARKAAPTLREAIRDMAITDGAEVIRGGPTAATDLLRRVTGEALFTALAPEVGSALRAGGGAALDEVLASASGINFEGLRLEIARRTSDAIYRAIGEEEAAIRADPSSAGDIILGASLR